MKYYTAFLTDNPDLHCTHKYFGTLSEEKRGAVETFLTEYFSHPRRALPVSFERTEWFGGYNAIRVLLPLDEASAVKALFPDLRARLDIFRKDDYGSYRPHISTPDYATIFAMFTGYALMSGSTIIKRWSL